MMAIILISSNTRRFKFKPLNAIILALFLGGSVQQVSADSWNNAGVGDWFVAGNWLDGSVPTTSDNVFIKNGGTAQINAGTAVSKRVILSDSSALEISNGASLTSTSTANDTVANGSAGTVTVNNGTWNAITTHASFRPSIFISNGGVGVLNVVNGGVVNATFGGVSGNGDIRITNGGTGTLNIGNGGGAGIINAANIITSNSGTATLNFNHTDTNYFFTKDGTGGGNAVVIMDSAVVNHVGSGTTNLSGANSYTGGTNLDAGTISISADNNLGSGTLIMNGGTLNTTASYIETNAVTLNTATTSTIDTNGATGVGFSNVISGDGNLIKAGTGSLSVTGTNTYTGTTTISAGTLNIGNGGATGSIAGDIINNATFRFLRANDYTHGGNISGTGAVFQNETGTVAITGDLTHTGGTTVTGPLQIGNGGTIGSISGDITNNNLLAFNRSDAITYGDVISGIGSVTHAGSGSTNLTGVNTYSGATTVNAGTLFVNGSIANSTATVNAAGTLGGTGTVGSVIINGGSFAPGNSIGTTNVAGNVDFSAGGTYQVEVNAAGQSDLINATGSATLSNGSVQVLPEAGTYNFTTDYTILTAAGGLGGTTFNSVTSNLAFLDPTLTYDANNVYLNLTRNDVSFTNVAGTPNQIAVSNILTQLGITNPADVKDIMNQLLLLTPYAGLEYTITDREDFTETGSFANLTVDEEEHESIRTKLGLRLSKSFKTDKGAEYVPSAYAAYVHEHGDEDNLMKAAFSAAPTTTFSVEGNDMDRDRLQLGFGLMAKINDNAQINFGYNGEFAGSDDYNSLNATLRVRW